jgi:hypothetical protein
MEKVMTPRQKALEWIVGDDTGISSETIWATMMGVKRSYRSHPHDPSDIGRCFRLLKLVPSWRRRLSEMRRVSPAWRALVKHWDELERMMDEEVGIDWSKGRSAPKTYERMQQILDPIEQKAA